jgi:hypothetical protein
LFWRRSDLPTEARRKQQDGCCGVVKPAGPNNNHPAEAPSS